MTLNELLFGKPISDDEADEAKIGAVRGVPVLGLDALASSSYGPEAALTVLLLAGAAGQRFFGPIVAAIAALLAIVYQSYRQTIAAYPDGGGSYTQREREAGGRRGRCGQRGRGNDRLRMTASEHRLHPAEHDRGSDGDDGTRTSAGGTAPRSCGRLAGSRA